MQVNVSTHVVVSQLTHSLRCQQNAVNACTLEPPVRGLDTVDNGVDLILSLLRFQLLTGYFRLLGMYSPVLSTQ